MLALQVLNKGTKLDPAVHSRHQGADNEGEHRKQVRIGGAGGAMLTLQVLKKGTKLHPASHSTAHHSSCLVVVKELQRSSLSREATPAAPPPSTPICSHAGRAHC
jgi:hypothetical protein